jgi:Fic family protein
MIYRLQGGDASLLEALDTVRDELIARSGVASPAIRRLRRQARQEAFSASTSIEGFAVARDAHALANREATSVPDDADRAALGCYALAMQHVETLAADPHFRWLDRVLLDLHFEACSFQRDRAPGLWRTGPVFVTRPGGQPAYCGPSAQSVPALMAQVVGWLADGDRGAHPAVRAAMAHLHLVCVHPFRDGNGRLARIVQSLVLARSGSLPPELGSIEPYLARHTDDYYAELVAAQGDSYDPARDASSWVGFCVSAHLHEARARLAQLDAATQRWTVLERLVAERSWPDRLVIALEQALFDSCSRGVYAAEAEVSLATASADLRRLFDAGWLVMAGRGRSVTYTASDTLRERAS